MTAQGAILEQRSSELCGVKWRKKICSERESLPIRRCREGLFQSALSASRPIVERREMDGKGRKAGTTSASCVSASSESRLPSDELALVTEEQGPPDFLSLGGDSPGMLVDQAINRLHHLPVWSTNCHP